MNIIKLNATDSTNSYLSELARNSDLKDEVVVVTKHQEKGRGQRDAVWQSQPSKSLTFSVFKRIEGVSVNEQFDIAMSVALAIVTYLNSLVPGVFNIKWPNDIMAEGKKCGGVLIENQLRGTLITTTIIGIGLNINEQNFKNLPQATSLYLVSNKKFDLDIVLQRVASEILLALNQLSVTNSSHIQEQYEQFLFKRGVRSSYSLPDGTILSGTITGVNASGQLLMELPDGTSVKFRNKEIEMIY